MSGTPGARAGALRRGDPGRLGPYRLVGRLGQGGMGTVYLAEAPHGELVAVKMVRPELGTDDEFRRRFRSEVNRVRQVPPFCTAEVLDADPDHDTPYLVVEYVDGPCLADVVEQRGPLRSANLQGLAIGVATALSAIHGAGVIHRDLKPRNVLLAPGSPKVIDFGIARALDATSQHTRTDQMVGTVAYMAPERFDAGSRRLTPAADIFSWGAVVAYAGTGRTPFQADSPPATAARILTQPPDLSGVLDPLHDVVAVTLAKDPADRPTARELLDLLLRTGSAGGPAVAAAVAAQRLSQRPRADPGTDAGDGPGGDPGVTDVAPHRAAPPSSAPAAWPYPGAAGRPAGPPGGRQGPPGGRPFAAGPSGPPPLPGTPRRPPPPGAPGGGPVPGAPGGSPVPGMRGSPVPGAPGGPPPFWVPGPRAVPRPPRRRLRTVLVLLAVALLVAGVAIAAPLIGGLLSAGIVADEEPSDPRAAAGDPTDAPSGGPAERGLTQPRPDAVPYVDEGLLRPGEWPARRTADGTCRYEGGLVVTLVRPGDVHCGNTENEYARRQQLTVDATLGTPGACASVWFLADDRGGYQVNACARQFEAVWRGTGGATTLRTYPLDRPIELDAAFQLGVEIRGSDAVLVRDAEVVGTLPLRNRPPVDGGYLRLGVHGDPTAGSAPYRVTFRDVTLYSLE